MAPYKSHLNIKHTSQAWEELCCKSVIGSIKKTTLQKGCKFLQGTSYAFQSSCQKKILLFKERIWLKRDLWLEIYTIPKLLILEPWQIWAFWSSIPTISAEKSFEEPRSVRVLWLSEAPLLLLLLFMYNGWPWFGPALFHVVRISFLPCYISHGCSVHHVSINIFPEERGVKPCWHPTSGEWWLLSNVRSPAPHTAVILPI